MGNFVMAVAHLIMTIGAFGYKTSSFIDPKLRRDSQ